MNKNWWIVPAFIIGYVALKKYQLAKTFSVFFKSLDFSDFRPLYPTVNLIVQVNNPTDATAEVQTIRGDLSVNGDVVGTVLGITPSVLQSGSTLLKIPVTFNYAGITDTINVLRSGKSGYRLDFNGTIMVDYVNLPLVFSYSL